MVMINDILKYMQDSIDKQEKALDQFEKKGDIRSDLLRSRIDGYKNAMVDVKVFLDVELKKMGIFYDER